MLIWRRPWLCGLTALLIGAGGASAGSLQIGPTNVTLVGEERTATISVRNSDSEPVTIQLRAMDWTQADGEDVHTASRSLVVSPPFATLKPGEEQTIRLLVENVPAVSFERAFRLVIDEVPNSTIKARTGVKTSLRLMSPVFLAPSTDTRPRIVWTTERIADGVRLTARNDGDGHERISDMKVVAGGNVIAEGATLGGYVLSRSSRSWMLPATPGIAEAVVSGVGAFGPVEARVVIAR